MSDQPLVSVIVPTKNSAMTLDACLRSIQKQTYQNIEIIHVDNYSTDTTQTIARAYTPHVYTQGPERSAQRNFAAKISTGEFLVFIDSDMELAPEVIAQCIEAMRDPNIFGLVIPEESFGKGFWAQCKKLERSFYVGVGWMEAARFFRRSAFEEVHGYTENMISGEDWDLSQRIEAIGGIGRISAYIYHNEGHISLWKTIQKKFYYAKEFKHYNGQHSQHPNVALQTNPFLRYQLFFSQPKRLLRHPLIGVGMLFMKTAELGAGAIALLLQRTHL